VSALHVECYAGYRGDERPTSFRIGERVFHVAEIDDRWYDPAALYFRVRAGDGNMYVLRRDEQSGEWTLAAFRAVTKHDPGADNVR